MRQDPRWKCTHSNDLNAPRSERLSTVLRHIARNAAKCKLARRNRVGEDAVDDRAALLASGAEDSEDLLGHGVCLWEVMQEEDALEVRLIVHLFYTLASPRARLHSSSWRLRLRVNWKERIEYRHKHVFSQAWHSLRKLMDLRVGVDSRAGKFKTLA